MSIHWALKEWQTAVAALLQGKTVLLLRKGGIREGGGQFQVASRRVLLLPTFEHQNAQLLKPEFQPLLGASDRDDADGLVSFCGWAEITHVFPLMPPASAHKLLPHLVWNQQFIDDRLGWKPEKPLYCMALRAYRLASPVPLPRHSGYNGCRSWVQLGESVNPQGSVPALSEQLYQEQLDAIFTLLPGRVQV